MVCHHCMTPVDNKKYVVKSRLEFFVASPSFDIQEIQIVGYYPPEVRVPFRLTIHSFEVQLETIQQ